jgi:hypothetical protein
VSVLLFSLPDDSTLCDLCPSALLSIPRSLLILGFLLILLSTTIYTAPHALPSTANLPLQHLTHSLERRLVLSLLCSLLNTSLASSKPTSGIGGVAGSLPYNYLISKSAEERRTLVRDCLMVLLVALDYQAPKGLEESMTMAGSGDKEDNAFKYFISKLVRLGFSAYVPFL